MPLDKIKGETVGDLGDDYVVVPLSNWIDTPLMEIAAQAAAEAYIAAGAMQPIAFNEEDILIQEYRRSNKVVVLFQRRVAGKEIFYPYLFEMNAALVAELKATGRWSEPLSN